MLVESASAEVSEEAGILTKRDVRSCDESTSHSPQASAWGEVPFQTWNRFNGYDASVGNPGLTD